MLDKTTIPDGLGGIITQWVEGAPFSAAIVKDSSLDARVAEKSGVTEVYTITVKKGLQLKYHDVFKRLKDGTTYRVTSNIKDKETPVVSSFQIGQVIAERWELV